MVFGRPCNLQIVWRDIGATSWQLAVWLLGIKCLIFVSQSRTTKTASQPSSSGKIHRHILPRATRHGLRFKNTIQRVMGGLRARANITVAHVPLNKHLHPRLIVLSWDEFKGLCASRMPRGRHIMVSVQDLQIKQVQIRFVPNFLLVQLHVDLLSFRQADVLWLVYTIPKQLKGLGRGQDPSDKPPQKISPTWTIPKSAMQNSNAKILRFWTNPTIVQIPPLGGLLTFLSMDAVYLLASLRETPFLMVIYQRSPPAIYVFEAAAAVCDLKSRRWLMQTS